MVHRRNKEKRLRESFEKLERAYEKLESEREMRKAVEKGKMKKWLKLELKTLAKKMKRKFG